MKNVFKYLLFAIVLTIGLSGAMINLKSAHAADAGEVYVRNVDYEKLTMQVYPNGNGNVYFASVIPKELSDWDELSKTNEPGEYFLADISWAAAGSEVSFYLRGDKNTTAVKVTLAKQPAAFKVKFDKVNGDFTFTGQEEQDYFFYRKNTDYNWIKVWFEGKTGSDGISYAEFIDNVEALRFKGSKLVFKLGQKVGYTETNSEDEGIRPSKDVAVSVTKYASAPSIKLNVTKMTFNTKTTIEWTDDIAKNVWTACEKNMELEDITESVFYTAGASKTPDTAIVYFRTAKTEKKPSSQISIVSIPPQKAPPVIGTESTADVVYAYDEKYLILTFNKATKDTPYEYCIVKKEDEFDVHKAKWKTAKSTKQVKLSRKTVEGNDIYFRVKGIAANATKGIEFQLPSAYVSYTANGFPEIPSATPSPIPTKTPTK